MVAVTRSAYSDAMNDLLTPPPPPPSTRYLRGPSIIKRYGFSSRTFHRLRTHPDPLKRFPRPALILGSLPLWRESDLIAYEAAHKK